MKLRYERRVFLMALAVGFPGVAVALLLLWGPPSWIVQRPWGFTVGIAIVWLMLAFALRRHIVSPLQTVSNVVAALREGDFSVRGRQSRSLDPHDTLEELIREVNELGSMLHAQRLGAVEAAALLGKVMEEIDVAVYAFDAENRLKLLNRSAAQLLNLPPERAIGKTASELELLEYLDDTGPRVRDASFAGRTGRWEIRRSAFREEGRPHRLLVFSDLTRTLREEELQAWQRIVRVIGHEINNSLTPIKSISGSLQSQMARQNRAVDWEQDLERGLEIIGSRAEALGRFMNAYTRLARLPKPRLQPVDIGALVGRVAGLETRMTVHLNSTQPLTVSGDADQLEQVVINLVRNAVDASIETGGAVAVSWDSCSTHADLRIEDEGPGLSNTSNLFVPFFTTKPGGSGIGLVLSRQIAEAHGGSLRLENRPSGRGCIAQLRLPLG
ncbi:MAG TPA: ATP-binding protein [Terriglobia bacterium]|nr:ATP-binding protein [Terriglobia bacterium]